MHNYYILGGNKVPKLFWGAVIGAAGNILGGMFSKKNNNQSNVGSATVSNVGSNNTMNSIAGIAGGALGALNAQGNTSQKQMQRADSIVDGVSSAVSLIPGVGTAIGAGIQLVNRLGGAFVKQPSWMKQYRTNQDVMANSAAFGGVANNALEAEATAQSYNKSGLAGKLVGRNKGTRNRFTTALAQQDTAQGILDENRYAKENMGAGADLFSTRTAMTLQGNPWNSGNILFGKSGIKIKPSKRGTFTAAAKKHGKSVQGFASQVLANKENYSPAMVKKANFARNAAKWHQQGGALFASNSGLDKAITKHFAKKAPVTPVNKSVDKVVTESVTKPATMSLVTIGDRERNQWNGFVDFVDSKGLKGSTDLDNKDKGLSKALWDEYSANNNIDFTYDQFVPAVQQEIQNYRNTAIGRIKSGESRFGDYTTSQVNDPNFDWDNNFMKGLSQIDGWAGSRTTSWKFPSAVVKDKNTGDTLKVGNKAVLNKTYNKFKEGGVVFNKPKNVVVDGPLHARKHKLKMIGEYQNADITLKGVPVIKKSEGGEIDQIAEVEGGEVILHYDLTKELEKLMQEGTTEAAIKAGKLLSRELIKNTKDKSKLIKELANG